MGVKSIEHATLIDRETADFVAERGSFTVPTMSTLVALLEEGEKLGLPKVSMEKLRRVADSTLGSLEIMKQAGVKMGLGTDLLGTLHTRQSTEFTLRAKVLPAIDVLRSACVVNAELLGQTGKLGCIRAGAVADLLVVDGNPLEDMSVARIGRRPDSDHHEGRAFSQAHDLSQGVSQAEACATVPMPMRGTDFQFVVPYSVITP